MVRREKMTIFLDATEETTVYQLKKMLEGIIKKEPEEQKLYDIDSKEALDDAKTLGDCGYKSQNAKAQDPASIGLAYRSSKWMCVCVTFMYPCGCVTVWGCAESFNDPRLFEKSRSLTSQAMFHTSLAVLGWPGQECTRMDS